MQLDSEIQLILLNTAEFLNILPQHWKTMQVLYTQYIYMYCRIISKVPNHHCTSALLMCMAMWQAWLVVHIITTSPTVKPFSQNFIESYICC